MKKDVELTKKESKLLTFIREDPKLDEELKQEYVGMARLFLEDLKANLGRTSIELDAIYGNGMDIWMEFLNYPVIKKYLQGIKDEQLQVQIDTGLMLGEKDAISLKKVMDEKGQHNNNANIIMIRLPEKVDYE